MWNSTGVCSGIDLVHYHSLTALSLLPRDMFMVSDSSKFDSNNMYYSIIMSGIHFYVLECSSNDLLHKKIRYIV